MQNLTEIPVSEKLKDSRNRINDNFDSVASDFSGTSFPALNLSIGMPCYRSDLKKTFRLTSVNPDIWTEVEDLNNPPASLSYINSRFNDYVPKSGGTFTGSISAAAFTGGLNGNSSTASKLKNTFNLSLGGALSSDASPIDGSRDVVVNVRAVNPGNIAAGNAGINVTGVASRLGRSGDINVPMTFNWSGQGGQPTWLWGGNDGSNMYVYNPSNFSVNYANSAGSCGNSAALTRLDWTGIGVSGSTQPSMSISHTWIENSGGEDNVNTYYTDTLYVNSGIGGRSYNLQELLQLLVNMSHTHSFSSSSR